MRRSLRRGDDEFYIDLLFYNYILHCYVAVDLKTGKFILEYAGKMNCCVIQTAVPPDTSKIPAELFLYFEKVAEWEEKV